MLLCTLGGLTLEGADFYRPKPLLLLAYLTLEGPRERRFLAELFWPTAARPLGSLAVALSQLRQSAQGAIEADELKARATIQSDAQALLAALEKVELEQALTLYQGRFLEGVYLDWSAELEEWVYGTREFLAARIRDVLLRLGEQEAARGEFLDAAKHAQAAYDLWGAPEPEPNELRRLYTLLSAAEHPQASEVRKEAHAYGIALELSVEEARRTLLKSIRLSAIGHNLPARATSFIGRDLERAELGKLISQNGCRLITLVGMAGIGKSRLALQVAHEALGQFHFSGGIFFVPLDSLTSPQLIPGSIAEALSLSLQGNEDPFSQIVRHIGKKHMLLVLDNYEHLMEGAILASDLLNRCPNLKLLVTSRERLNLEEEMVLSLEGLLFPSSDLGALGEMEDFDAPQLFVERARRARSGFAPSREDWRHVLTICRLVDGSPLGIELAAAWVRLMTCAEIAEEIEKNLDFLATSTRNAPDRHKSIRATFEHSWKLLSSREQEVLRKLSVFKGGFRREAAAEVAGATIPVLASLVDKSLLRVSPSGRYDRHPLLYQYTQEKLAEHPLEQAQTQEKHGLYYLRFLRERYWDLRTRKRKMTLEVIEEELPNIRAAWSWAIENKRVDEIKSSAFVLNSVYEDRGPEVGELFSKAVASLDETNPAHHAALGYTLLAQAGSLWHLTRNREAKECARRGLELLRPLGETHGIMVGLGMLGMFMWIFGDFARAKALFEEGLALSREHEHPGVHTRSRLLWDQAMLERELSEFPQVKRLFQEALAEVEQLDDLVTFANLKHEYGMYLVRYSFAKEGEKLVREGLRLMRELSHPKLECSILVNLALATYELGEVDQAEAILLEALALAEKLSMKDAKAKALARLGKIMMARGNYPEAQHYLRESLQLAWKWEHQFSILEALTFSSELSIAQAKGTTAAELLGMVRCQPAFLNEHGREVERLLVALSNQLSPEELEEALEWGKSMPLEEVVEGTLRQLLES